MFSLFWSIKLKRVFSCLLTVGILYWSAYPAQAALSSVAEEVKVTGHHILRQSYHDYRQFYSHEDTLRTFSALFLVGGLSANTSFDTQFQHAYQGTAPHLLPRPVTNFGQWMGGLPQLPVTLPLYFSLQTTLGEQLLGHTASRWANQALRISLLMAPQQGIFAQALGAGRPEHTSSRWRLGTEKRAVSGHASYGAVPFLAAANVSKTRTARWAWTLASTLPALARIQDGQHYPSQAFLGWGISWLASRQIHRFEHNEANLPFAFRFHLHPKRRGFMLMVYTDTRRLRFSKPPQSEDSSSAWENLLSHV